MGGPQCCVERTDLHCIALPSRSSLDTHLDGSTTCDGSDRTRAISWFLALSQDEWLYWKQEAEVEHVQGDPSMHLSGDEL